MFGQTMVMVCFVHISSYVSETSASHADLDRLLHYIDAKLAGCTILLFEQTFSSASRSLGRVCRNALGRACRLMFVSAPSDIRSEVDCMEQSNGF